MATQVVMPQLGITTVEGTITRWLKNEGETVSKGDPLFEITTDKVNMVVEALAGGVLRHIIVPAGQVAKVTEPVAIIGEANEDIRPLLPAAGGEVEAPAAAISTAQAVKSGGENKPAAGLPARRKVSPLARRIAAAEGVSPAELDSIAGTGIEGAVIKDDVLQYAARKRQASAAAVKEEAKEPAVIPLNPMRRAIADRMTMSNREAPQFWLGVEFDFSAVIEWRGLLNQRLAGKPYTLTYTDFFVKACALALKECPFMNASYTPAGLALKTEIHVGVAVALDDGLIVPVIRDADKKSLADIAQVRGQLVEKAKDGRLTHNDITGGTFTISNLGMYAVDQFVAILNPPESGILSVGRVREVLEMKNGQIVSVSRVAIGLTADHRSVDGAQGARFLESLVKRLEDPYQLLL